MLHKYEVYNDGPSTLESVEVVIDWPVEVQSAGPHGKWLLYLTKPPVATGEINTLTGCLFSVCFYVSHVHVF